MRKKHSAAQLTAPIVAKDGDRRLVKGPVLVPGERDEEGDVVSAAQIERVAHGFMSHYRNVDLQHSLVDVATPVESYVTNVAQKYRQPGGKMVRVPAGSWMLAVRVDSDATWAAVKRGELTGFSIMAVNPVDARRAARKGQSVEKRRVTLADLNRMAGGERWVVPFVSLVDEPGVPKAKFISVKSKRKGTVNKARKAIKEIPDEALVGLCVETFGNMVLFREFLSRFGKEAAARKMAEHLGDDAAEEVEVTRDVAGRKLATPRIVKRARDSQGRFVSKAAASKQADKPIRDVFGRRKREASDG